MNEDDRRAKCQSRKFSVVLIPNFNSKTWKILLADVLILGRHYFMCN